MKDYYQIVTIQYQVVDIKMRLVLDVLYHAICLETCNLLMETMSVKEELNCVQMEFGNQSVKGHFGVKRMLQ